MVALDTAARDTASCSVGAVFVAQPEMSTALAMAPRTRRRELRVRLYVVASKAFKAVRFGVYSLSLFHEQGELRRFNAVKFVVCVNVRTLRGAACPVCSFLFFCAFLVVCACGCFCVLWCVFFLCFFV